MCISGYGIFKKSHQLQSRQSPRLKAPNPGKRCRDSFSTASPAKNQFFEFKEVTTIQHYETTDIFLGAYLLCHGGNLSGISFNERHIATFAITGEGLHQLDRDYVTGRALVNPVQLRTSLNHLRDLLFDMRDRRRRDENKPKRNRQDQANR
jgi:hypothetical protein